MAIFCSSCKLVRPTLSSQSKHEESKANSKLTTEVRRKLGPQTKEKWLTAEILQGCEFSQPAEFHRLRNFATCSASIFLFPFHHLFYFFLNCPFCIVGSLDIFVISLDSEHYISLSQALYKETPLCNKIGAKVSSFPAFLLLSDFLSLSFTLSPAKHSLRMTTQGMLG